MKCRIIRALSSILISICILVSGVINISLGIKINKLIFRPIHASRILVGTPYLIMNGIIFFNILLVFVTSFFCSIIFFRYFGGINLDA